VGELVEACIGKKAWEAADIPALDEAIALIKQDPSVIIMRYETTHLKQLREALEKKQSPDPQMQAENDKLRADAEFWMKEAESNHKKYLALLADVKANVAERVAADNAEAHKG